MTLETGTILRINKTQLYGIIVTTFSTNVSWPLTSAKSNGIHSQIIIIWEDGTIDIDAKLKVGTYDILWVEKKYVEWYYNKQIIAEELTYHHLEYLSKKINFNKIKRRERRKKLKQINAISE